MYKFIALAMLALPCFAQPTVEQTQVGYYLCEVGDGTFTQHSTPVEAGQNIGNRALAAPGRLFRCTPPLLTAVARVPNAPAPQPEPEIPEVSLWLDPQCVPATVAVGFDFGACLAGDDAALATWVVRGDNTVGWAVSSQGVVTSVGSSVVQLRADGPHGSVLTVPVRAQ